MIKLSPVSDSVTSITTSDTAGLKTMIENVKSVVSVALGIITLVIIGFAIYLAIKFFTAEDDGKRKNAKQQLVYAIIGIVIMIALMILAPQITNAITAAVKKG